MVHCITCNVFRMRQFCRFFYCLTWFDTVEFKYLPDLNNEMYDDAVLLFDSAVNWLCLNSSIDRLSRLLHAHIAYEIDTAKIIAAFSRISYCLHDLIWLNSIVCHVQITRCTMMWFSMIDFDINWLCLKCVYWQCYLYSLIVILHLK